jgi:succinate-semialdehyde dehydrogenase/glutarate-semialdehyde dehydrogenase
MRNMGEACTAANRFYVHDKVHDAFAQKLTQRMAALKMGNGLDDGVTLGPLVNAESRDKVTSLEDEVVAKANDTEYGLIAYLYTGNIGRGMRVSEKLDFGMIGLNRGLVSDPAAPFGGMKQSGLGREGAHEGLMEFLETQYVSLNW